MTGNDEDIRPPHRYFHDFLLLALIIVIPEHWTRYYITKNPMY